MWFNICFEIENSLFTKKTKNREGGIIIQKFKCLCFEIFYVNPSHNKQLSTNCKFSNGQKEKNSYYVL